MDCAVASRRLQFCAGPQTHTFYACSAHRAALTACDVLCFLPIEAEIVKPVDPEDDIPCDLCREG